MVRVYFGNYSFVLSWKIKKIIEGKLGFFFNLKSNNQ